MSKIYTKTGDKGFTSLLGGTKVPKSHFRIVSFGSVDELNSYIGLLAAYTINVPHSLLLKRIQDNLFSIGAYLANDPASSKMVIEAVKPKEVESLEKAIDQIQAELPELRNFILPGGHKEVAFAHIARTVCRRAERDVVFLNEQEPVDEVVLQYLNRLSDYIFVLARWMGKAMGATEVIWSSAS